MSDVKRIQLTTISDGKKLNDSNNLSPSKTTRFEINVDLFEPNADSFPEFNYRKLLHVEKKKHKKTVKSVVNGLSDPFEENDNDVERIAKEFEKKYGGANNSYISKKSNRPVLDYCDKGAGYDDNDSFIDNTEAYDEIIPEEVETVSGGFYINSGLLEFKQLSNFERPEDVHKMPKPKKRALSTSSESSEGENPENEAHESEPGKSPTPKNGHLDKKSKVLNLSEEENNIKTNKIIKEKDKKSKKETKDESVPVTNSVPNPGVERDKQIKTTTVKDMLRAKRDSILNMKDGSVKSDSSTNVDKDNNDIEQETTSSSLTSDTSNDTSDVHNSENGSHENESTPRNLAQEIKLPSNITEGLTKSLNLLKELAPNQSASAKQNFFNTKTLDLLLNIDNETRNCDSSIRSNVFAYLEGILPFTKKTILTRIRKFRLQLEENKANKIYSKLKKGVDEVLPNIIKNYDEECQKINQIRSSTMTIDEKLSNSPKLPRKRFHWNDNLRKLLFDLYILRKSLFTVLKPRKETVVEFVDTYLSEKIINIWPQGWMRLEELQKEIERKRTGNKKPKENKKPAESVNQPHSSSKDKILTTSIPNSAVVGNGPVSSTSTSTVKETSKTVLSTNNSLPKTSDKPISSSNTNKTDKTDTLSTKKPGNTSSTTPIGISSSLTITPVNSTASASSNKPLPSVQNKVTITNVDPSKPVHNSNQHSSISSSHKTDSNKAPKILPSSLNNSPSSKQSSQIVSSNIPNSMSISITTTVSNSLPQNTSKESNIISISPTTSRKTSDYSINSIMSSTSSTASGSNNLNLNAGHSNYSKVSSSLSVDDMCSNNNKKNETIENSSKRKLDNNASSGGSSSNVQKDSVIKVRSVANMNNSFENKSPVNKIVKSSTDDDDDDDDDDEFDVESDSSDCVEIVGVFPVSNKKPDTKNQKTKPIVVNKNKYNIDESSYHKLLQNDHLPKSSTNHNNNQLNQKINSNKRDEYNKLVTKTSSINNINSIDNELDVLQIMKDLKELQELQQPKYSSIHSSESNYAVGKSSGYSKSALKDQSDSTKSSSKTTS